MSASSSKFSFRGTDLAGPGVSFDAAAIVESLPVDAEARATVLARIVEILEVVYREGRSSVLPSCDDRFDLSCAVEALRAVAVIAGPIAGERHRRAADVIARLLEERSA